MTDSTTPTVNEAQSPLPWRVEITSDDQALICCAESDALCIAECFAPVSMGNFVDGRKEEQANAAFIVKACNSHAALVSALEAALTIVGPCAEPTPYYGGYLGGDPSTYQPDREVNSPQEIANWEHACYAWAHGPVDATQFGPMGMLSHPGIPDPIAAPVLEQIRAALTTARGGEHV